MYNVSLYIDKSNCITSGKTNFIPRKDDILELNNKKYLVDSVVINYDSELKVHGVDIECKQFYKIE